ncbi:MAG: phosphatase PAP2 family protein [Bacteroidetes bacterium]|nr:phosphatase PAP2 family protein [Bacteroidota bacterium]MCL1968870.1 phosphatase PAP2 family protein [Bacteroidota bacterium]
MLDTILHWDTVVTLFLNGFHTPCLDTIMYWISNRFVWLPLYLFIFIVTIVKWKKKSVLLLLLLVFTIAISDQSCNLLKKSAGRLRPSHTVELEHKIHLVAQTDGTLYRGGQYGFPSAHSSNAMVFALFVFFFAGNRKMWVLLAVFLWAALLGYSRIYLGVHYWLDVECGYLLGAFLFLAVFAGVQNSKFKIII